MADSLGERLTDEFDQIITRFAETRIVPEVRALSDEGDDVAGVARVVILTLLNNTVIALREWTPEA